MRFWMRARTKSSVMANSRRWSRADAGGSLDGGRVAQHDGAARVATAVARALALHVPRRATVVVGLFGGRDSVALLDSTFASAPARGLAVVLVICNPRNWVYHAALLLFCMMIYS